MYWFSSMRGSKQAMIASETCVIIMPTYRAGRSVLQNASYFRLLLNRVVEHFSQEGEAERHLRERLAPLIDLQRDDDFGQQQTAGVRFTFATMT